MSEKFSSFLSSFNVSSSSANVIVPTATATTQSGVVGTRVSGSTTQLHSIYLTMEQATKSTDPIADGVFLSISVYDNATGKDYFIAHNVEVLPHSSFYIEKTITLQPNQSLRVLGTSLSTSKKIHTICSGIDIY